MESGLNEDVFVLSEHADLVKELAAAVGEVKDIQSNGQSPRSSGPHCSIRRNTVNPQYNEPAYNGFHV